MLRVDTAIVAATLSCLWAIVSKETLNVQTLAFKFVKIASVHFKNRMWKYAKWATHSCAFNVRQNGRRDRRCLEQIIFALFNGILRISVDEASLSVVMLSSVAVLQFAVKVTRLCISLLQAYLALWGLWSVAEPLDRDHLFTFTELIFGARFLTHSCSEFEKVAHSAGPHRPCPLGL